MTCKMYVFEWMTVKDFRKFPSETMLKPVRYQVHHDPGCDRNCTPEQIALSETLSGHQPDLDKQQKWDFRMLSLASVVAGWSKDPSTKIGAVIARPDNTVLSLGFNGFPRGCADDPGLYEDRVRKYERVVHAELNAILTAPERPQGCTLYVWPPAMSPGNCSRCAAAIIQAGITRVVHLEGKKLDFLDRWGASYAEATVMYGEAGVAVVGYPIKEFAAWMRVNSVPLSLEP
jgi:dCMP deaminase